MKVIFRFVLFFHVLLLVGLSLSRFCLYFNIHFIVQPIPNFAFGNYLFWVILQGLWRDNVLVSIISLIPFMLLCLPKAGFLKIRMILIWIYYSVIIPLALFASIANIPYFTSFYKIVDKYALSFLSGNQAETIVSMILAEPNYLCLILINVFILILSIISFAFIIKKFYKKLLLNDISEKTKLVTLIMGVGILSLVLLSRPSNVNQARFSTDPQYDKMAICAPLYLVSSYLNSGDAYGPAKNFVTFVSSEQLDSLRFHYDLCGNYYPGQCDTTFERHIINERKLSMSIPNIVLIQMEGLSFNLMSHSGCEKRFTPFLDSIYDQSLSFSNCYSIGPRTNYGMRGLYSSWPTFLTHHAIQSYLGFPCKGLSHYLHESGYYNVFYLSHDLAFDGLDYYLPRLQFDRIYSQKDYPDSEIVGPWGCNDGYLFNSALSSLNDIAKSKSPFFACIMTISNHPPYILPQNFKGVDEEKEFQAVEYADSELRKFYKSASQQDWFDNTLFVFVADHGNIQMPVECELPEQLNHIPLIINGVGIKPDVCESMASQMDVMAIILGLLGIDYYRNNFSIDVLTDPRKYVVYSSQTCFGCRNQDRLYVYNADVDKESFYIYDSQNQCIKVAEDSIFEHMRNYMQMIYQMADNKTLEYRR